MTETLQIAHEIFSRANQKLDTIKDLLDRGEMKIEQRLLKQNGNIEIQTLYAKEATISIGVWNKQGSIMKSHIHENIVEYLVCMKGSFGVTLPYGYRILKTKDCASIPENCLHSVVALEDNSKMVAVCVPAEKSYQL